MELVKDPVIVNYFSMSRCLGEGSVIRCCTHPNCIALRVLEAMTGAVEKGDKFIRWDGLEKTWTEEICMGNWNLVYSFYHPFYLRLPERFQARKKIPCSHDQGFEVKCLKCEVVKFLGDVFP